MKVRLIAATTGAAALLSSFWLSPVAHAAETDVTFTISSGGGVSLAVITPDGNLSDPVAAPGGMTSTGNIGVVKVTDLSADVNGWTVSAAMAGPFASASDSVACTAATITSGAALPFNGAVVYTPALAPGALASDDVSADEDDCAAKEIGSATALGANDATFTTSISIAIPADTLAGDYTGTVTQTAA